jgi:hypothetical protein
MEMLEDRLVLSTFLVESTADTGPGSLRQAVLDANASPGADTITFDLSLTGQTIVLGGVELAVSDDLSITGLGADKLTISGNNASRVFSIGAGVTAKIEHVTIASGKAEEGGGIYNEGTLTIKNSTLTNNSTTEDGYYGGAICSYSTDSEFVTSLTITDCTFTGNTAHLGGGIANVNNWNEENGGMVTITGSTFSENSASNGGAIYHWSWPGLPTGTVIVTESIFTGNEARIGGALYSWNGLTRIASSTFSNNTADRWGGAICTWTRWSVVEIKDSTLSGNWAGREGGAIDNNFAALKITNSTISGNSTNRIGGGIYNWGGDLEIANCTLTGNRADADGDGSGGGGGLYDDGSATYLLHNTIVAGNLLGAAGSDSPDEFSATLEPESSHNLIGDAATAGGLEHGVNGNIVGNEGEGTIDITTVLDPNLAENGGPTLTHALVEGSLALNAGDNDKAVDADGNPLVYDQRGDGFARIYGGTVDIGAFEEQPQSVQIDVKPGSDPNAINLSSNGLIAVAIFTTDDFDASQVDAGTVVFAGASAVHSALEDVDGDGDLDMVLHFQVDDTNLADVYAQLLTEDCGSSHQQLAVSLTGETYDGTAVEGTDGVDMFFSGKALRDLLDELAMAGVL